MKPARAAFLLSLAVAAALAGCARQDGATLRQPCPKGLVCLEYGNGAEPNTLDPQLATGVQDSAIVSEFMVGLTDYDAGGKTIPGVATHWESSADGLKWTFHLGDSRWSDGAPVTAEDYVAGLRRAFDPKLASEQAAQFYAIKNAEKINGGKLPVTALGVYAPDPKTVVVELDHPWPILADYLSSPIMSPMPRHIAAKWGDAWVKPEHFVGNGAFLPVSWKLGDRVIVRKNPNFVDADKVCVDRITYYPTVDAVSAERRVRSGELDLAGAIPSNRLTYLKKTLPDYLRVHNYVGLIYLAFNMKDVPALRDVRVRQALSMSIDRQFIVDKLLQGGEAAYSTIPPGMIDYDRKVEAYWAGWPLEKRQAEARRLLAAAGYGPKRPLKLELKHRNSADPSLYVPSVQADWRLIGVNVQLAANEAGVAYASYRAGDFEVADGGWVGGNDAIGYLFLQRQLAGPQNITHYFDKRYEALTAAADKERDLQKRMDYIAEAEKINLAAAPVAPVYYTSSHYLVNPALTGWVDNDLDNHRARYLCFKDAAARRAAR